MDNPVPPVDNPQTPDGPQPPVDSPDEPESDGDGDPKGNLPQTGTQAPLLAGALGVVLLAAGAFTAVVARRRASV